MTEVLTGEALRGSRWNELFAHSDRPIVINSLTMSATSVDDALAGALIERGELPPSPATEQLVKLRIVATDDQDDDCMRSAFARPDWAGPILDLFMIPPADRGDDVAIALASAVHALMRAVSRGRVETVKLRLSGAGPADREVNAKILASFRDECNFIGVTLVSLLMADQLAEATRVNVDADAYYFRWRPRAPDADRAGLDGVRGLLRAGKMVAVQVAVDDLGAIVAEREWFEDLAQDTLLMRDRNVLWDVGLAAGGRAYFLPAVCHRSAADTEALERGRALLTELGIPVRAAIAPYHLHPGCPLMLPHAQLVLPSGRRVLCTDETAEDGSEPFDPRAALPTRLQVQLGNDECMHCSALPFCASRCPKLTAPAPGSSECEAVKLGARRELERLLDAGLLRVRDQGEP